MSFETHEQANQQDTVDYQLALLGLGLREHPYPSYPAFAERLVADPDALARTADGRLVLPEGSWNVDRHANRSDGEAAPTVARQEELREQGYKLDSQGRPLHPWLFRMIADPLIGVVSGKGFYWEWGANRTADAIVVKNGHVLLVKRRDTGEWALPGGFVNTGEPSAQAAKREVAEETDLSVPATARLIPLHQGPVADTRATAHAWPETSAFLFDMTDDNPLPEVHARDDAEAAAWVELGILQDERVALFGAHRYLLAKALGNLDPGTVQELDLLADAWTELLATAPLYTKTGLVRIRPATPGSRISTVLANQFKETENVAGQDQVIVTNPGGEEHIIDASKAASRYEPTDTADVFRARGKVRALVNPTGSPIVITAPWGEQQYGASDCLLAALYREDESHVVDGDRYIIGAAEFAETYGPLQPTAPVDTARKRRK